MKIVPSDSSAQEGRLPRKETATHRATPSPRVNQHKNSSASAPRYMIRSGVVVEGFRALERMIRDNRRTPDDVRMLVAGTRFDGEKVLEAHSGELEEIAANGDLPRLAALIRSIEANAGALSVQAGQDPYPILERVVNALRSGETRVLAMRRERILDLLG